MYIFLSGSVVINKEGSFSEMAEKPEEVDVRARFRACIFLCHGVCSTEETMGLDHLILHNSDLCFETAVIFLNRGTSQMLMQKITKTFILLPQEKAIYLSREICTLETDKIPGDTGFLGQPELDAEVKAFAVAVQYLAENERMGRGSPHNPLFHYLFN